MVIVRATGFTRHGNWHITVDKSIDLKLIVNFLIEDDVFSFWPGCSTKNTEFTDLFYIKTTEIALGKPIDEYLKLVWGNWEAILSQSFNPSRDNTESIIMAIVEREAHLVEDFNYNL